MTGRESLTRCLTIVGSAAVLVAIVVAGVVLAITLFFSAADKANQAPTMGDTPLVIAAIGDSFMSGEGASAFFPGTDRVGRNQCRRTNKSYPFLVARALTLPEGFDGVALTTAACSGATTTNVIPFTDIRCTDALFPDGCPSPQYEYAADGSFEPTYQIEHVPENANVVLVMVGAGDAQLVDILALCAGAVDSCRPLVIPWLEALGGVLAWRLQAVYESVAAKAHNAHIFAVTYPTLHFRDACGRTKLDQDETEFLTDEFIPALNRNVELAAAAAGIHTIDLTESFAGHRLCQPRRPDGNRPRPAVNAFQIRPVRSITWKLSNWFHGSFHPNEYGHELMADAAVREIDAVLAGAPDEGTRRRTPTDAVDAAEPGPTHLAATAGFTAAPPGDYAFENSSPCDTQLVQNRTAPRPTASTFRIAAADAGTSVCFRPLDGTWTAAAAEGDGFDVPLAAHGSDGFGGWHEILYQSGGQWVRITVVAPSGPGTASLPLARAWLWPWMVTFGQIVAHPLIFATLIALIVGGALMWCTRRERPET